MFRTHRSLSPLLLLLLAAAQLPRLPMASLAPFTAAVAAAAGGVKAPSQTQGLLGIFHYDVAGARAPENEQLSIVNLDLLPDDVIAGDIEDGVQEEFEAVDASLGDTPALPSNATLPEHRASRQLSLIYQGVYVPDARFNPFVDGVMVNMVAAMRQRFMDPLYFRVHKGGSVQHVSTLRQAGDDEMDGNRLKKKSEAIGGGVIRGLTKIKRFGNAEVQVAGNATLVRSHYVFGPLDVVLEFNTTRGRQFVNTTLTSLAGHGLADVSPQHVRSLDFIIDSPSEYEVQLRGAGKNARLQRLSHAAVMRLVRREGRLEIRLMRMFERGGKKYLPDVENGNAGERLWPLRTRSNKKTTSGSRSRVGKVTGREGDEAETSLKKEDNFMNNTKETTVL